MRRGMMVPPKIKLNHVELLWRNLLANFFHHSRKSAAASALILSCYSANFDKPSFGSARGESGTFEIRIDFEMSGLDRFDLPAVGERGLQFFACDAAWPELAGFFVAEAHEENVAASIENVGEPVDILAAVVVAEDVEEAGIDDRVEAVGQLAEFGGVGDAEVDVEISLGCFCAGSADWFVQVIEACDLMAFFREVDGHVA